MIALLSSRINRRTTSDRVSHVNARSRLYRRVVAQVRDYGVRREVIQVSAMASIEHADTLTDSLRATPTRSRVRGHQPASTVGRPVRVLRTDLHPRVPGPGLAPPHQHGPGRPKRLSDAELVCLAVAQVLLGARSKHHWLRMCRAGLGHLFPYLPKQPGYHKRLKAAAPLICQTTMYLAGQCPSFTDALRLFNATPVRCGMSRPTVQRSELAGFAGCGYCASHSRWYWGLKLYHASPTNTSISSCALNSPPAAAQSPYAAASPPCPAR
jgi:hypothetical protein